MKKVKYEIKPFDEVHDIYLLHRQAWWIFSTFVSAGSKAKLEEFVKEKGGELINK